MALNINFSGFVYRHDNSLGDEDIYYRVYFRKVSGTSSPSQWDTYKTAEGQTRLCENTGFFSFNLGDAGLLTQDGNAGATDEVVVTFFIDENDSGNDDKDSCTLTEIGAYKWTLTSATVYSKNMQVVSVDESVNSGVKPSLDEWRLNLQPPGGTSDGVVFTNYAYSSVNCAYAQTIQYATAMGGTMYHWWTEGGVTINDGFRIVTREYDFDDGVGFQALASTGNNQWATAGIYECLLRLTTCFGNSDVSVAGVDDIEIKIRWRAPVPDIDCLQDVANHIQVPDTVVTFQYNGTDLDNKIGTIDWTINDPGNNTVSNGHNEADVVPHTNGPGTGWFGHAPTAGAFGTSGNHSVDIVIHWDNGIDGTSTPVINFSEIFIQDLFTGPTVNFTQAPPAAVVAVPVNFTNTSANTSRVGTAGAGEEYDWRWNDNGSIVNELNKAFAYVFTQTPVTTNVQVTLFAHWNDGFSDQLAQITKNVIFAAQVTVEDDVISDATCIYVFHITGTSSGGGNPTGYKWEIFYEPSGINELVWTSPTNLDQQDKRFYFAKIGEFRVKGYVYGAGSPTSDFEDIIIDSLCVFGDCPPVPPTPVAVGGGAPPYRQNAEEVVRPFILVKKVESKVVDTLDELIEKIQVKLVD